MNAQAEVPLSSGILGTMTQVNVLAGDCVKQGDMLACGFSAAGLKLIVALRCEC